MTMETWWREISDLDNDQRQVIGLPPVGSYLVKGPPGSGKTNLLLLRANYLTNTQHSNLAIVVFNRTLREFIRAGSNHYNFDTNRVVTIRQFFSGLLSEAGVSDSENGTFNEIRLSRIEALNSVFPAGREPIYDVVLLDETQDYLAGEIELFCRLARDVFMVADSRQQIYPGDSNTTVLEAVVDRTLDLRYHYRNGQPICAVADGIGRTFSAGYEPILPTSNYNSPGQISTVEVFQGDLDSQSAEIARRLIVQRRAYPDSLLGVISPRRSEVRAIADALRAHGFADDMCVQDRDDGYQPLQDGRPIWVSTVHSSKGLEFRALHFAAANFVTSFGAEQKRLAYTAVTRAKTALVIYHEGAMPGYLDSALNAVRLSEDASEDLEVAFGRRE